MKYPTLNDTGARREFTDIFGGLDVNDRTTINGWAGYGRREVRTTWAWSENATVEKYPAAATRRHRRYNECPSGVRGLAIIKSTNDAVQTVTVGGVPNENYDSVFVNGAIPEGRTWHFARAPYKKHIVNLGKNVYFLRSDKNDADVAEETSNFATHNGLDSAFDSHDPAFAEGGVRYYACDIDGKAMITYYSDTPPSYNASQITDDVAGLYWVDSSGDKEQLKKYSTVYADWIPVSKAYIKIFANTSESEAFAFLGLKEGDAVIISGAAAGAHSGTDGSKRKAYNDRVIKALNTSGTAGRTIIAAGDELVGGSLYPYIIVEVQDVPGINGLPPTAYVGQDDNSALKITRTVPVFEHVCAGENRIWGCTSENNEIRCCKLGDPSNWNTYTGISTDSYAVTVGGETGAFTGAAFAFGSPIFFKENAVIRIYGTAPSNYRLQSVTAPGVAAGSEKSVAVVNGAVFYLSPGGVCYYDGSTVHEIGEPIGGGKYKNGVGAGADGRYYLSCEDDAGAHHLFVFDLERAAWMREDSLHALYGASVGNSVTFIEQTGENAVRLVSNRTDAPIVDATTAGHTEEGAFDWELITPVIGYESPDNKYISRFNIRLLLDGGSRLDVYVRYDNAEAWEHKTSITSFGAKSFTVPIRPRRCDHMQIRFAGHGDCVLYSLAKIYEEGSDVTR